LERAAEVMQIGETLDKYPGGLGGGQQQRVALARTVVGESVAFLMDEPLSDLDAKLKVEIRKEIQRIHDRIGEPAIYVTHDQEEAMTMSDRIVVMNQGTIEQIGDVDQVYQYPNNLFVAQFIGNPSMNLLDCSLHDLGSNSATVEVEGSRIETRSSVPTVDLEHDAGPDLQTPIDPLHRAPFAHREPHAPFAR
jgi:multiple sugar transport system ATP-binding protein